MKQLKIFELLMTIAPVILIGMLQMKLIDFEPDHLIVVLGSIPVAFKLVTEIRSDKLEKFSTANVLAVGYVKNFAGPLIDAMVAQQLISTEKKLHIFLPDKISDFESSKMNKLKASLNIAPLSSAVQTVVISQAGDKRNIIDVSNTTSGKSCYIDFPGTLLSLNALLDYEMKVKINDDNQEKKDQRGKAYVAVFKTETQRLLKENGQEDLVAFVQNVNELP
jgi:Prokaryotic STING domain